MELRPYQTEAVKASLEYFREGTHVHSPIVVAPMGAGKSIYIAHLASELEGGVLVLQPSKELLEQNLAKYRLYGGEAAVYSASMGSKEVDQVTFATIGSIKTKADLFSHVKYVLIDECHLLPPKSSSMFMTFLKELPDVKVLGLTATAFRLKKYNDPFTGAPYSQINLLTRERPRFFNRFLHITQIRELYDQGYLCPIKYIELTWNDGELRVNTTGAEFTEASIDFALQKHEINRRLPGIIKQSIEKGRRHRLVFVNSVYDAQLLAQMVPSSAAVSAMTPKKERAQILTDFKSGKIQTVFNVGVLTIGFDFPELDTIIIARPTMSLALFMQMIGRGIRLSEGKEDVAVVDMCGNTARFGHIEDIQYTTDADEKWILTNGEKVLSGVKLQK